MTTDPTEHLIERYKELMERRQQILLEQASIKTSIQHHKKEYDDCMTALKQEFNVTSLDEATQLRESMKDELVKELKRLQDDISAYDLLQPVVYAG